MRITCVKLLEINNSWLKSMVFSRRSGLRTGGGGLGLSSCPGAVLVTTPTMREELTQRRIRNVTPWSLGVDTEHFHPRRRAPSGRPGHGRGVYADLPGPVFLYVGRLAVEKNVEGFLDLDLPGSQVVVGDVDDVRHHARCARTSAGRGNDRAAAPGDRRDACELRRLPSR